VSAAREAPNYRVTCQRRVGGGRAGETRLLASAAVSGPPETDMRLALRAGATELQGLLGTLPEPDTVNLAGLFFSRRQVGRSRRGLPLWEEDSYRRWSRVPWGGSTVLYPFGRPGVGQRRVVWVGSTVSRAFALAVAVDVGCLRVVPPESAEAARVRCGRLDDIARRVALVSGDTLMATFGWPPAR